MNNGGIGIAVEAPGFDYPMPIAQSRATAMQAALSRWFPAEEGILDRINESRPSVRARDFFIDDRNAVDKERIREKLMAMRKAFWITLIGMVFGCFIAVPGLYALTQFACSGQSFIHPYLGLFMCLIAVAFLVQGLLSAMTLKRQIEKAVGKILS
ncbi:MAG: hypothetical protein ABSB94_01415 [Syntrophorhabdales bacterium]